MKEGALAGAEENGIALQTFAGKIDGDVETRVAAAGACGALEAVGREGDVTIVSVDGGCPGVQAIAEGALGPTSRQYPLLMASTGIEAIKAWTDTGEKPENTPGLAFFNTGVARITNQPVDNVDAITSAEGLEICRG